MRDGTYCFAIPIFFQTPWTQCPTGVPHTQYRTAVITSIYTVTQLQLINTNTFEGIKIKIKTKGIQVPGTGTTCTRIKKYIPVEI